MRMAVLYLRGQEIYLHASSRTEMGAWVAQDPYLAVDSFASRDAVGDALKLALANSKEEIEHPKDFGALVRPLLKRANCRSWKAFANLAKCCTAEQEKGTIVLIPHRNLGPDGGFKPMLENLFSVPDSASARSLYEVITSCFDMCL